MATLIGYSIQRVAWIYAPQLIFRSARGCKQIEGEVFFAVRVIKSAAGQHSERVTSRKRGGKKAKANVEFFNMVACFSGVAFKCRVKKISGLRGGDLE